MKWIDVLHLLKGGQNYIELLRQTVGQLPDPVLKARLWNAERQLSNAVQYWHDRPEDERERDLLAEEVTVEPDLRDKPLEEK